MKVGVLFTGGKDSTLALQKVMKEHEVKCLITVVSENKESFMFHTANIEMTKIQAKVIGIPLLLTKTKGEKEKELGDLKNVIKKAIEKYYIKGVVSGAIASNYQKSRIEKICDEFNVKCICPLWQKDYFEILEEIVNSFEVIITKVSAYPLTKKWLGKKIDKKMINDMKFLKEKYGINPVGEGGEFETIVLDAPFFKKKIIIKETETEYNEKEGWGILKIKNTALLAKKF